jgi:hypothetical protein
LDRDALEGRALVLVDTVGIEGGVAATAPNLSRPSA